MLGKVIELPVTPWNLAEKLVEYKVFYSWQMDTPEDCNKKFIRQALDEAVVDLSNGEGTVLESPRVDSGMEGISGSPEVASVMFDKIAESVLFVGDVTLVGTIKSCANEKEKWVPNPNVLLEMGFAAGWIGWNRVINVMNEEFADRFQQPFDVRNRRFPIDYKLASGAPATTKDKIRKDLRKWLKVALETADKAEHNQVEQLEKKLDTFCLCLMHANGHFVHFPGPDLDDAAQACHNTPWDLATMRLLDLGILRCHTDPRQGMYSYHWTYIGKLVLLRIGIDNPASQ